MDDHWTSLRDTLYTTTREVVGFQKRQHRDWFDENNNVITDLLYNKHQYLEKALCNDTPENRRLYRAARSHCQRELHRLQNQWWLKQARDIESFAEQHDSKSFFKTVKLVSQRTSSGVSPIDDASGQRLSEKVDILARWKEHFSTLLNQECNADLSVLDDIPHEAVQTELEIPPTSEELEKAMGQLANNKAPGPDGIPVEVLKAGGEPLLKELHTLLPMIWEEERVPQDFKDGHIVTLFKKNCRFTCGNYRGITLLSITGKLYARVILNRIWPTVERHYPEAQCSFRGGRSTNDMMFALRQLIEKCHEQHQQLHLIFVDLVKAFDTVNRPLLWSLLAKIGIPTKIINIIKSFHDGMNAKVSIGGELTDSFEVSSGLRQGCIMAPALFILLFAFVLRKSHQLIPDFGIDIRHKLDGRLFNLRRLKAKSATTMRLSDFLYADDAAHGTTSPESLQDAATALNTTCKEWGLTISKPKTEVMHINCDDPYALMSSN